MCVLRKAGLVLAAATALVGAAATGAARAADPPSRTCFGEPATVVGTNGDDVLVGEAGVHEVFQGGPGNDTIIGGEFYDDGTAGDLICGGRGDDWLRGARGDDRLSGGPGDDVIDGSNGADLQLGGPGDDRVGRGSFADADAADDVFRGGPGHDTLTSDWGHDHVYGGEGPDELYDSECSATFLSGGDGNDFIESWSSSFEGWEGNVCAEAPDTVRGGDGRDTAQVDALDHVSRVEHLTVITQVP